MNKQTKTKPMTAEERYAFWCAPLNGTPESSSGGLAVMTIPGMGQWVLLMRVRRTDPPFPKGAIPCKDVQALLKGFNAPSKNAPDYIDSQGRMYDFKVSK